jgi:hypothetical protein
MRSPVVLWWTWLAFAVLIVMDLAIQWHHRTALVFGAFLALGTGLAYTCALRPCLIANDAGITIINPLRSYTVPWRGIRAVDVREAVRVHLSLSDGTEKIIPSWGLSASSRAQLRADLRARRRSAQIGKLAPWSSPLPAEAGKMTARTEFQLIARQLADRAERARADGAATGQLTVAWAWGSVAALAVPAIALLTLLLT